jgi:hypothetical protein
LARPPQLIIMTIMGITHTLTNMITAIPME